MMTNYVYFFFYYSNIKKDFVDFVCTCEVDCLPFHYSHEIFLCNI